jgi:molecular chaperone GrpE
MASEKHKHLQGGNRCAESEQALGKSGGEAENQYSGSQASATGDVESKPETCEERLVRQEQEIARLQEQLKRVTADSENYRKRLDANFERRIDGAKEDIFRKLLPIVDHLEMAVEASHKGGSAEALCQGVELVLKDALKIFEGYHVVAIEAKGQPFDQACHEAVMMEESAELPDETVSKDLKKGYKMGDRVLRPSMVCVSRQPK